MNLDPGYQRAHAEASRRLPLTLIVVIVVILAVVFGYDYIQRAVNPTTTTTITTSAPG
jgi:hypothetical protein